MVTACIESIQSFGQSTLITNTKYKPVSTCSKQLTTDSIIFTHKTILALLVGAPALYMLESTVYLTLLMPRCASTCLKDESIPGSSHRVVATWDHCRTPPLLTYILTAVSPDPQQCHQQFHKYPQLIVRGLMSIYNLIADLLTLLTFIMRQTLWFEPTSKP